VKKKTWTFSEVLTFVLLALGIALPMVFVAREVFDAQPENWRHFRVYLLPSYLRETFGFVVCVVLLSWAWGIPTAYFLARYDFWGRGFWRWGLVMPLAMPAYIVAYCYAGLSIEVLVNFWGCALILSLVLYPYIYLSVKPEIETQSLHLLEAGKTLGMSENKILWTVVLPLLRPSIFAGAALVAMETLNEYGAVRHFGVNTLTLGLFKAWNAMDDKGTTARLALIILGFTVILVGFEKWQRRKVKYFSAKTKPVPRAKASQAKTLLIWTICLIPFLLGFALPFVVLFKMAVFAPLPIKLEQSLITSLTLATVAALISGLLSLVVSGKKAFASLISSGYAIPGAVLAIGIVILFSKIEKNLPFLLSGSYLALLYGYQVRFLAVGFAPLSAARLKINPSLEQSAWLLGKSKTQTKRLIIYPLLAKSFWAAVALLFVEVFKELPMTLVLRPFGFHSLATRAFELATDEQLAQAAIPSLLIALVGAIPIFWLVKQSEK
jgi:iron(III) transport system permease protein